VLVTESLRISDKTRSWKWYFLQERLHAFVIGAANNIEVYILFIEILEIDFICEFADEISADVAVEMTHKYDQGILRLKEILKFNILAIFPDYCM